MRRGRPTFVTLRESSLICNSMCCSNKSTHASERRIGGKICEAEPADSGAAAERLSNFQLMMDRRNFVLSLAGFAAAAGYPRRLKTKSLPTFVDVSSKSGIHFRHQSSRHESKVSARIDGRGRGRCSITTMMATRICSRNRRKVFRSDAKRRIPGQIRPALLEPLYRHNRDGTFTDVTEKSRLARFFVRDGCSYGRLRQ